MQVQPMFQLGSQSLEHQHDACPCTSSAGGAQDVENFRENIKQGYLPLPTDITFEGVIKYYFFDTART
jgi:hypothetical protein